MLNYMLLSIPSDRSAGCRWLRHPDPAWSSSAQPGEPATVHFAPCIEFAAAAPPPLASPAPLALSPSSVPLLFSFLSLGRRCVLQLARLSPQELQGPALLLPSVSAGLERGDQFHAEVNICLIHPDALLPILCTFCCCRWSHIDTLMVCT
ncbi:hypothetical protein AMELA_G00146200 [Ameiurus melas]|uniref:Uncharacterized protein n=1 Tax=Ameiurus melas TaxID=219545 RepID=A0A7J6AGL2_AMEME|nr:hypothetical protein AMELA_G00146200 [Ameiurus melas]